MPSLRSFFPPFVVLPLALWLSGCSAASPLERPNVLLLVVDTLRADALGTYGQEDLTPRIDAFAERSFVFENFVAQSPTTINSAPAILHAVYPSEHGYTNYQHVVPDAWPALPERLQQAGYRTFGVSTNPHVSTRNGLARGFDTFREQLGWKDSNCDEVNAELIRWLEEDPGSPFFAMLWYIDPHAPYAPPVEHLPSTLRAVGPDLIPQRSRAPKSKPLSTSQQTIARKLYAAEVRFFDEEFGKLVEHLERSGLLENTVVILTSDHGESFWEKTDFRGRDLQGHSLSLYRGELRVPLVLHVPGLEGGRVTELAQHIDLAPTVLDFAGLALPAAERPFRGRSLRPLTEGRSLERPYVFSELVVDQEGPFSMAAVQTPEHKLVATRRYRKTRFDPPRIQLLDLAGGETELDLEVPEHREIAARLERQLDEWEGSLERLESARQVIFENPEEEEQLRERLKALGYLE